MSSRLIGKLFHSVCFKYFFSPEDRGFSMRDVVYCFTNFTLHFSALPISTFIRMTERIAGSVGGRREIDFDFWHHAGNKNFKKSIKLPEFLMCLKLETSKISDTFRYKRNIHKIFFTFLLGSSISYFIFSSADTGNDDLCAWESFLFLEKQRLRRHMGKCLYRGLQSERRRGGEEKWKMKNLVRESCKRKATDWESRPLNFRVSSILISHKNTVFGKSKVNVKIVTYIMCFFLFIFQTPPSWVTRTRPSWGPSSRLSALTAEAALEGPHSPRCARGWSWRGAKPRSS